MSKIKACSEKYASYKPHISTVITAFKAIADQKYNLDGLEVTQDLLPSRLTGRQIAPFLSLEKIEKHMAFSYS